VPESKTRNALVKAKPAAKSARTPAVQPPPKTVRRVGRPVDSDSEQTRRDIVLAATTCFARQGYATTTLRGIAHEAGLTPGTLYHHYATKADLYQAVYQNAVDEMSAAYAGALAHAESFEGQLRAILSTQVDLVNRSVPAPLIVARAWIDHTLEGTPSVPVESSAQVFMDTFVEQAVSKGDIPRDEREFWGPLIRTMIGGLGILHLTGAYPSDIIIDGFVTKMIKATRAPAKSGRKRTGR
jgi:AcrR family transcriptional regulator